MAAIIGLLLPIMANAQSTNGLIAHWNFNNNTNDASGNGHHASTVTNITYTSGRSSQGNTAAHFNGHSSAIVVPSSTDFNFSQYSICAVFKTDSFNNGLCQGNYIVSRDGGWPRTGGWGVNFTDNPFNNCNVYDSSKFVMQAMMGSKQPAVYASWQVTPTIRTNTWYSVVATYSNNVFKIYIDGTLVNTVTASSGSYNSSTATVAIGHSNVNNILYPYWFGGDIDDIKIFNRVIGDTEIVAHTYDLWINQPFIDTTFCAGDTFTLNYSVNKNFQSGNSFVAELSSASGSFSSPTTIGTSSSLTTGGILCTIPSNTTSGTGYRIRIRSSSPYKISDDNGINISIGNLLSVTASNNTPICAGGTLSLGATPSITGNITYSWTGPNSFTSTTRNPSKTNVSVSDAGNYIVTASLGSCSDTDTTTVIITPTPAKPTASSNTPVCPNTALNLYGNSSTSGVSYNWTGPNSFTSTTQNPTISSATFAMAGTYSVTATLNGCTSAAETTTVAIAITTPTPQAGSNAPICTGQRLNLTASNIANATYMWTGPNGFTATQQNPTVAHASANHAGTYYVKAIINGCESLIDSVVVTINAGPTTSVFPSPGSTICVGETATFVAITNNAGSAPSYTWLKNSNTISGATSSSYTATGLTNGDMIQCVLSNITQCPSHTDTSNGITMTVNPYVVPTVSITSNPLPPITPFQLITFTATSTNHGASPTYQWMRNGQPIIGATNNTWATYQLNNGDSIYTVLTSSDRCAEPNTVISNGIKVEVLVSVADVNQLGDVILYPNPNNGTFTIAGTLNTDKEVNINVINVIGQSVYKAKAIPNGNELNHTVNTTSQLAAGTYLLHLQSDDNETTLRFTVQQ